MSLQIGQCRGLIDTKLKDFRIMNLNKSTLTMTEADIKDYFNIYKLNNLNDRNITVEKINSKFNLAEYEKNMVNVQKLKYNVKIQAGN